MNRMKMFLAASLTAAALLVSGCMGSFSLTHKVYAWNDKVSNSKPVNSLLFFLLLVVPVYEVTFLADWLFLNTVEAAQGSSPVSFDVLRAHRGGHEYVVRRTGDASVQFERDGVIIGTAEQDATGVLVARSIDGTVLATSR